MCEELDAINDEITNLVNEIEQNIDNTYDRYETLGSGIIEDARSHLAMLFNDKQLINYREEQFRMTLRLNRLRKKKDEIIAAAEHFKLYGPNLF